MSFQDDLKRGNIGEDLLLKNMPELTRLDGYNGDFAFPDGTKMELKTDSYRMKNTPCFFLEVWSDFNRKKPGGVFRAKEDGCKVFAYLFINDMILFLFDVDALIKRMKTLDIEPTYVENRSWTTVGLRVKRELLKDIYKEVKL